MGNGRNIHGSYSIKKMVVMNVFYVLELGSFLVPINNVPHFRTSLKRG